MKQHFIFHREQLKRYQSSIKIPDTGGVWVMSSSQSAVSYLQHRDYPSPLSAQSEIMLEGTSDVSLLLCSILPLLTGAGAEVTTYTDLSTNQVSSHTCWPCWPCWPCRSCWSCSRQFQAAMSAGGSPGWVRLTSPPTRLWTATVTTRMISASCQLSSPMDPPPRGLTLGNNDLFYFGYGNFSYINQVMERNWV